MGDLILIIHAQTILRQAHFLTPQLVLETLWVKGPRDSAVVSVNPHLPYTVRFLSGKPEISKSGNALLNLANFKLFL